MLFIQNYQFHPCLSQLQLAKIGSFFRYSICLDFCVFFLNCGHFFEYFLLAVSTSEIDCLETLFSNMTYHVSSYDCSLMQGNSSCCVAIFGIFNSSKIFVRIWQKSAQVQFSAINIWK